MKSIMQAAAFGIMAIIVLGAPQALANCSHVSEDGKWAYAGCGTFAYYMPSTGLPEHRNLLFSFGASCENNITKLYMIVTPLGAITGSPVVGLEVGLQSDIFSPRIPWEYWEWSATNDFFLWGFTPNGTNEGSMGIEHGHALFITPAIPTIKEALEYKYLYVRITLSEGGFYVVGHRDYSPAAFPPLINISGLGEAIKPVRELCGW